MAMLTVKLIPDHGEPVEIEAGTRDVYVWEKTNHGKTFAEFTRDVAVVDLYEIAWHAARRQGVFTGNLKDFVETYEIETEVEEKEDEDDDDKAGPFGLVPSEETSSPSRSSPASRRRSGQKKAIGR